MKFWSNRILCLYLIAIVLSSYSLSQAQTKPPTYNYKNYWTKHAIKNPNAQLELHVKKSPLSGLDGLATVTVTKDNKATKDEVFSLFKKVFESQRIHQEKIDQIEFLEILDSNSSTLYRVGYNPKTKQFSLGSVRLRNLLPTYLEMHLIQVESLTGQRSSKSAHWLYEFIVRRAYAQSMGQQIQSAIVDTGQQILSPTNSSIDGVAASINGTNASISRTGDKIEAGADRVSASIDRTNNTFKSSLSAENVAKLTAVGAFSATLTSALTTFAINGTWEAAKKIYFEVTGQFTAEEKKARLDLFEKSFKEFAEVSPKLNDLNRRLDIFSSVINSLSQSGSVESVMAQLDSDIKLSQIKKTEAGSVCTSPECLGQDALLDEKALDDIRKVISAAGGDVKQKMGEICTQLDGLYMAYVDAELKVTSARRHIIQNTPVFMGAVSQISMVEESMQEKRKSTNACLDPVMSQIRSLSSQAQADGCGRSENASRASCVRWASLQKQKEICEGASDIMVTDDLKGSLAESASVFNEQVGNFSRLLGSLDCSKKQNDQCVQPGPYREAKAQMQSKLGLAAVQCPQSVFAKSFKKVSAQLAPPDASAVSSRSVASESAAPVGGIGPFKHSDVKPVAESKTDSASGPSFWQKVKNFFKQRPQLNEESARYHESMYSGG